jgi:hypothetical protein
MDVFYRSISNYYIGNDLMSRSNAIKKAVLFMTYLSILKTAFFSTNLRNSTKQILLMNKNLNIFSLFGSFFMEY